jgi:hypothetical protein
LYSSARDYAGSNGWVDLIILEWETSFKRALAEITYIEWNETDTIKSISIANGNTLVLTKAWHNDYVMIDENTENLPEIIKN